jgi:hypothetical protein
MEFLFGNVCVIFTCIYINYHNLPQVEKFVIHFTQFLNTHFNTLSSHPTLYLLLLSVCCYTPHTLIECNGK